MAVPTATEWKVGVAIPLATPVDSTGWVIVQNYVTGSGFVAVLADLGQGKATKVFTIANADLPLFMYYSTYKGRVIVPNTPPGPRPGGNFPGLVRGAMQLALITTDSYKTADAIQNSCPIQ